MLLSAVPPNVAIVVAAASAKNFDADVVVALAAVSASAFVPASASAVVVAASAASSAVFVAAASASASAVVVAVFDVFHKSVASRCFCLSLFSTFPESGDLDAARSLSRVGPLLGLSPEEQPESFSGFITVGDTETDSNMFFWFVPAIVSGENDHIPTIINI